MKDLPPLDRLQEIFVHDPHTGYVYKKAGHETPSGYVYIYVDGKQYAAHRIIWKMETGKDPEGVIDHINGITSDNRIENLRDISHQENMKNNKAARRKQGRNKEEIAHKLKMLREN